MKIPSFRTRPTGAGFTLVELLVSISILSIILLTLAQAIGYVSQLWVTGIGTVDNYTKARNILSIMDRDIQQMVMRPDIAAFATGTAASPTPACAFYTNVQGSPGTDTRTSSLVQYLLSQTTLSRLNYGMNYTTGGITPAVATLTSANPIPPPLTIPNASTTDTLATGVIQFQWQFVDGNGNILTPSTPTKYNFTYNYTTPSAATNPRAIVISVLVLSNSAYLIATQNAATITKLQTVDFPITAPTNSNGIPITYSQYWNGILNPSTGTLDTTLPPPIRSGLKVFQRYIPLPVAAP
jgi:prepilin-type N-terminal cleavage/methylation domain-containing protein